ncbi:MAG: response regulator transcription factor [Oscillospiraceae bacterium]|nr:response regulator transcription factor [Oscillospiraceae bacterium]
MRLLLAEDERSLSRAVCALLEKNNYAVDPVYDGQEALDYLESGNYDALILDVMMPKLDGFAVLRQMRARGDNTPVIMLTARSDVDDKVEGLDAGANDYLTKPFEIRELLARIRAMTRQTAQQQPDSCLRYGNTCLDCARFELSGPEGSFKLSGKEFQMMELFLRNPRNLLSTEQLMEKIWGFDSDAEQNVVWVYLSYLRKKLTAIGSDVQIKAQRGVGYYLEVAS